jgi:transposase
MGFFVMEWTDPLPHGFNRATVGNERAESPNVSVLGIDLAKQVFQVHGVGERGHRSVSKRLRRASLAGSVAQLPPCLIGVEACGSAHFWARKFQGYGHDVRLISPQFVKPYVKSQKNDANDAEAVSRPHMRFVPIKTPEQQDMQAEHRVRQLLVKQRTALVAAVGDAQTFRNGRQFAAWLGLVPRQLSSGG